jgi:phosphoglucomutase
MSDTHSFQSMRSLLFERYGELGAGAAAHLERWLTQPVPYTHPEIIERHLTPERVALVFDAFWQVLPFGTGGRRGRVGYGPNRINETTVALAIQGHCQFLRAQLHDRPDIAVVVANDVRVFHDVAGTYRFLGGQHPLLGVSSRSLAKLACEIYAGNGIVAYLAEPDSDSALLTTPELSFLIPQLGAAGGVMMSASHNPPDDNGLKLYDSFGSQPVAPDDQSLLDVMGSVVEIKRTPFAAARAANMIRGVPKELHERYLRGYVELYGSFFAPRKDMNVVYTPLCGAGLTTSGELLTRLGFPTHVPPGETPDGSFAVIPFRSPNPEVPQSTQPAQRFADTIDAGIVLSSDPDADRIGLEVKLQDGSWYHFDGNQIATVLCYALMLDPEGPRRAGLVIETLVTTKTLRRIAELRGDSDVIDDLLVGFKYVADVLKTLRAEGRYRNVSRSPDTLVIAAEESHGAILLPTILDKDAAPACAFLAGLYQRLRAKGQTLLDYYAHVIAQTGGYDTVNRSIMMAGAEGVARRDRIMAALRASPPTSLAGHRVTEVVDFWDERVFGPFKSESDKLPRNVLQLTTPRVIVTIRPSGTEPKLKYYCHLVPGGAEGPQRTGIELLTALRQESEGIARRIYGELLAPLGVALGPAALLLPDIIELDRKVEFEMQILPGLRAQLESGALGSLDAALAWLKDASRALLPGSDPLPALKAPLAHACEEWAGAGKLHPTAVALRAWATGA